MDRETNASVHEQRDKYSHAIVAAVTLLVMHLPRNTEEVGSNPGTGRYIVAQMTN